jgi:hypothetical protein
MAAIDYDDPPDYDPDVDAPVLDDIPDAPELYEALLFGDDDFGHQGAA